MGQHWNSGSPDRVNSWGDGASVVVKNILQSNRMFNTMTKGGSKFSSVEKDMLTSSELRNKGMSELTELVNKNLQNKKLVNKKVSTFRSKKEILLVAAKRSNQDFICLDQIKDEIRSGRYNFNKEQEIVQMARVIILEAIFEPAFSMPHKSPKSAIKRVINTFTKINWFVQGRLCLNSIEHPLLIQELSSRIEDQIFIDRVWKYIKVSGSVGYQSNSPLSCILADIYLDSRDKFMEFTEFSAERVEYVRFRDEFLIGVSGSIKDSAMVQSKLDKFHGKVIYNTSIIHATTEKAFFRGTYFRIRPVRLINRVGIIHSEAPINKLIKKLKFKGFVKGAGEPTACRHLIHFDEVQIIRRCSKMWHQRRNFYNFVDNKPKLGRIYYIIKYSCALTLALKIKLKTKAKVFDKYGKDLQIKKGNKVIASFTKNLLLGRKFMESRMLGN
jgi:hypothetical protein